MIHLNLDTTLGKPIMKPEKPEKPEDRAESWLRKMSERIPRRRSKDGIKAKTVEPDDSEDDQDEDAPSGGASRKAKKKRKKDDGCTWPVFVFFALAAYGAWKLFTLLFG
jgi:hypothetical protein